MDLLESIDERGVATLTLNRPERHNAFDGRLVAHLTDALRTLDARADVRVVLIRGNGQSFSAGGDIDWMKRMAAASFEENLADAGALAELMHGLDRLSKPTIAFVHGAAYGGGVGLAACCDIVIATESASFCLSEARLGIIPAVIGPFVIRAIGARQARRYALTAEVIFARTAREIGLVHEAASEEEAPILCEKIVAALLRCAPGAQAEAKFLVAFCQARAIDGELARETARRIAELRASPEGREGLEAFLEKRSPSWKSSNV
jgi:methylglutaconyl-CoA hydratase